MRSLRFFLLAVLWVGCNNNCNGPETPEVPGTPTDFAVTVVDMIPESLSGESNQDSEPFLAVDAGAPDTMVGSAFTPNPFGTASGTAPVYVTTDGGATWTLNMIVPSTGAQSGTGDIAVAGGGEPLELFAGILRIPGTLRLNTLRSADFTAPDEMEVLEDRVQADQPVVQTAAGNGADRLYVTLNDLAAPGGRTATVDLSVDDGDSFEHVRVEHRGTMGQDGPSVRSSIAADGTVYAAFFGWRAFAGGLVTSDVVVVRDDDGVGPDAFEDLVDPGDGLPGRRVVEGVTIPWSNAQTLGFERIGSTLTLAVDPNDSDRVYVGWADRRGTDIYTLHVRGSSDRGATWSEDLRTVSNATCISLAVAGNGALGFLYQQLTAGDVWRTFFEQTHDDFASRQTATLSSFPQSPPTPTPAFLPYLGDYNFLLAVGDEFRGIFSAANTPVDAQFPSGVTYQRRADFAAGQLQDLGGNPVAPSIDPFYFEAQAIGE